MTVVTFPPTNFPKTEKREFPGEAPSFDCIEELKLHIGTAHWHGVLQTIGRGKCTVCTKFNLRDQFGIEGWPIECLYDFVNGRGAYTKSYSEDETRHMKEAYEEGKRQAQEALKASTEGEGQPLYYDGWFPEDFKQGAEDGLAQADKRLMN